MITPGAMAPRDRLAYLLSRPASEVPAALAMGRSVGSIFALDAAYREALTHWVVACTAARPAQV